MTHSFFEQTPTPTPTLVLVCKRPSLGFGKQRLAAQIGIERAYVVAECLLDCGVEDLYQWPGIAIIAPDHADHLGWAKSRAPFAQCIPQAQGNLGERLNTLDQTLRTQSHERLIFIGSDSPAITLTDYQNVLNALCEHDTVLINARDGGVVLMASSKPWPSLVNLPWSTASLGGALRSTCLNNGHSVVCIGECFDIDEAIDFDILRSSLKFDLRPARLRLIEAISDLKGALCD